MNFSQYTDFDDFCKKEHYRPEEALKILDQELEKIREGDKDGSKRSVHS